MGVESGPNHPRDPSETIEKEFVSREGLGAPLDTSDGNLWKRGNI